MAQYGTRPSTPLDFWNQVKFGAFTECWPWTGLVNEHGYGRLTYHQRQWKAHRLAWTLIHGPIPAGLGVLHHCDNPPCCNPFKCLFLGTQKDNSEDMVGKNRHGWSQHPGYLPTGDDHHARLHPEKMARGERNGTARLTAEQVAEIWRRWHAEGGPNRRRGTLRLVDLAAEYNVAKATITMIVTGQTWTHVTGAKPT